MEHESACGASPTPHTPTLQAWFCFGPESKNPVTPPEAIVQDSIELLRNTIRCVLIAPVLVISDCAFIFIEEATEAIRALKGTHLGMTYIMSELGLMESLWKQAKNPLGDMLEVCP